MVEPFVERPITNERYDKLLAASLRRRPFSELSGDIQSHFSMRFLVIGRIGIEVWNR